MPEEQKVAEVEEQVVEEETVEESSPEEILEEEPVVDISPPDPDPEPDKEPDSDFRNDQYVIGSQFGMSPEQVRSFGTPENFDQMITATKMQHNAARQPPPQAAPPAGNFQLQNPDDYDEGIVGMNNHMNYRMMQMEAMLSAMHQQNERLQAEAIGRALETTLDTMDENLFGRGPLNALSEDQARNRISVANEFARTGAGYMQQGLPAPSIPELAQHSANALFADNFKDRALKEASEQTRDVASQASARPTQQEESPVSGTDAAIRAAAEWHREHGTNAHDEFG
jgi:hypothetical protein